MNKHIHIILITSALCLFFSCAETKPADNQDNSNPKVSVKTSRVTMGNIESNVALNGSTLILNKNSIVAPINGYLLKINVRLGDRVKKDDVLFEIQTKEQKALAIASGLLANLSNIKVVSHANGVVSNLADNQPGAYITEGGSLCTLIDINSMMVQVNVPYQYMNLVKLGGECSLYLPDNTIVSGAILKILPLMDDVSQTQQVLIKPITSSLLPENLHVSVYFIKYKHVKAFLLPKASILANETQTEFWIMKLVNDTLAIHIPVEKGIENDSVVEILSPKLSVDDLVISEGGYGLPDSSLVKVVEE